MSVSIQPLRSVFKYFTAVVLCAASVYSCLNGCSERPEVRCQDSFEIFDREKKTRRVIEQPYYCDEIIVWPGSDKALMKSVYDTLSSSGFEKIDSCECLEGIELWGKQKGGTNIDLQGIVKGIKEKIKSSGDSTASVSTNYQLDLDLDRGADSVRFYDPTSSSSTACKDSVKVGVIDGGVNRNHILLKGVLSELECGTSVDSNGHGTHINGILANARPNGKNSVYGSAIGSSCAYCPKLINVKITRDSAKTGSLFQALCGMQFAVKNGARILNLSWGFYARERPELLKIFADMHKDVLLVAAAGNDTLDLDSRDTLLFWPAALTDACDNVVSVAACDSTGRYASFSNRGNRYVDLLAPGEDIWSTDYQDTAGLVTASGTSMAVPFVSRAALIYLYKQPGLKPAEIKKCLTTGKNAQGFPPILDIRSCACPSNP